MTRAVLTTLLVLTAGIIGLAASASSFTFQPIGSYPNAFDTEPRGLNRTKTVVGFYQPMGGFDHGYLQKGRSYKTIEPPGVLSSYVEGINDGGTAAGGYCDTLSCNPGSSQHGFLYSQSTGNGKYTKFDYPTPGYSIAPMGINSLNQVVGGYCPAATCPGGPGPSAHAFLRENGAFTTLDFPSAFATQANAINDSGVIVGAYFPTVTAPMQGYMYQNGVFTSLEFPGANWTWAAGINNAGTISGSFQDQNFIIHGFTYSNGVFTQVDVSSSTSTALVGISSSGDVVATANINNVRNAFMGLLVSH